MVQRVAFQPGDCGRAHVVESREHCVPRQDAAAAGLGFSPSAGISASSIARYARWCRRATCCQRVRSRPRSSAASTYWRPSRTVAGNGVAALGLAPPADDLPFQLSAALRSRESPFGLLDLGRCHQASEYGLNFSTAVASALYGCSQYGQPVHSLLIRQPILPHQRARAAWSAVVMPVASRRRAYSISRLSCRAVCSTSAGDWPFPVDAYMAKLPVERGVVG